MEILLGIAIAMAAGLFASRITKLFNLPAVTAYLIAGILVGPYLLGALGVKGLGFNTMETVHSLSIICDVALGFIAFSIGNEFRLTQLKSIGKAATIIGILQAIITTVFVDAGLIGLHYLLYYTTGRDILPISAAITLGAIAAATAPAATLMVVRQYKAEGKLTDLLLPVVAIDDAVGLVVFAISFGIAKALGSGPVELIPVIVNPIVEIVLSLVLGAVMGIILTYAERFFHSNSKRLSLALTVVILTVALSKISFPIGPVHIGFSPLLVCMMLGTIFCNMCDFSEELMEKTDKWTVPLFMLFFVISGAELELSVFKDGFIILIGVVYIIFRSFGKCFGARWSADLSHCDSNVKNYLGITLLPQAGVALGMAMTAAASVEDGGLGEQGAVIRNIVLFGVLVYELVGPTLTRIALTKAGDIKPKKQVAVAPAEEE